MDILTVIRRNLSARSRTRRPTDAVALPDGFRGRLDHQTELCTGCGTCAYVCSPAAIHVTHDFPCGVDWRYDAGQCTYCGKCMEYCPTQAIRLHSEMVDLTARRDEHLTLHRVEYQPCARCGQPIVPMPEPVLARLYGGQTPRDVAELHRLCEKCRSRAAGQRMKSGLRGSSLEEKERA